MRVARTVTVDTTCVEEVPDLEPGPGEVVCRILACATCGSDVMDWYVRPKLPAVLGHEPAGEVTAVGEGVTAVEPGDRVAIHHHVPCATCDLCLAGRETLCRAYRASRLDPGGFAEAVRLEPALVSELLPLDGMDPVLATFTEPLGCVLRAQDRVHLRAEDALLVVGAGCSGLLHIAAARARGVETVLVAELDPERRERAVAWGAEPHDGSPVDAAVACAHTPAAVQAAAEPLAPGGRLLVYAPPPPEEPPAIEVFLRELTVTASWGAGPTDMRAAFELLRSGILDPLELVQLRVGLEDTGRALAAQRSGEALKAVVLP